MLQMSPETLKIRLDACPRIPLAEYPTPLERLPRLSLELRREVYVKRDDGIGPGLGGNKTRKLEYLLAEAQEQGARKVVTFGGLQSNHARITAASANKVGLEPHLFYFERRPVRLTGNLLINHVLGAKMHFVPMGGDTGGMTLETTNRLVRWLAWLRLGPNYFIPGGGHSLAGCLGYVKAALEIDEQARDLGLQNAWLVLAAGSGGTLAGLMAGLAMIDSPIKPLGIDVVRLWKGFKISIANQANELCAHLGGPQTFEPQDVPLIEERYVGAKYGSASTRGLAAIRRLAQLEGLLVDPIYTAKAFAGLLDLVEKGEIGHSEPVIFLHTGGLPAVFAFQEKELIPTEMRQ